jgi:hypothetical protein
MTVLVMSRIEIDRMAVLHDLAEKRLTVSEAGIQLRLCSRQVLRLAKAYRTRGPSALVSRSRGRPSNRSYPLALRAKAIEIIRERYADFGPQLASEKLAALHDIHLYTRKRPELRRNTRYPTSSGMRFWTTLLGSATRTGTSSGRSRGSSPVQPVCLVLTAWNMRTGARLPSPKARIRAADRIRVGTQIRGPSQDYGTRWPINVSSPPRPKPRAKGHAPSNGKHLLHYAQRVTLYHPLCRLRNTRTQLNSKHYHRRLFY